jgi:hypothetical protein
MKNLKTLAALIALGLSVSGLVIAQDHDKNASDHGSQHHGDPASIAAHLAQFFPKIAPFDANKDGKLDKKEKEALAKAVSDGKVELPNHIPSNGNKPAVEAMIDHIGEVYPVVARYDKNHDGVIDEKEQAALKNAIERGELDLSHGQQQNKSGDNHH